jgi:hypothetical protein
MRSQKKVKEEVKELLNELFYLSAREDRGQIEEMVNMLDAIKPLSRDSGRISIEALYRK